MTCSRALVVQVVISAGARAAVVWWVVALVIFAGFMVSIAKTFETQIKQLLGTNPGYAKLFSGADLSSLAYCRISARDTLL